MRRIPLILLAFGLAGCCGVEGPLETYRQNRARPRSDRVDAPGYTIEEQEKRARSRFTLFEDDPRLTPPTGIDRPGPTGR
jgi:predicted small lipoprotein YifL